MSLVVLAELALPRGRSALVLQREPHFFVAVVGKTGSVRGEAYGPFEDRSTAFRRANQLQTRGCEGAGVV